MSFPASAQCALSLSMISMTRGKAVSPKSYLSRLAQANKHSMFFLWWGVSASMCCTFPTRDSGYRDVGLKLHPFRESARVPGTLIRSFNVVFFAAEEDLTSFGDKSEKSESCWKSSSTYFALKRDRPT